MTTIHVLLAVASGMAGYLILMGMVSARQALLERSLKDLQSATDELRRALNQKESDLRDGRCPVCKGRL